MTEGSKPTTVSPALLRHAASIVAGNQALAWETEQKVLDAARLERGVLAVLRDPAKGFYLVAVDEAGEVVGQLMVTYEWSDWRDGTFWWIQSVYVVPPARRRGVYRALYQRALEMAKADNGVCGVRLYVERKNTPAQATYEALGMMRAHYEMFEVDFVLGSELA
ncbi:MAG: GNAT family N-acetyltransferase [Myxococcales bacterium]|nr:GNAT family N-acetyltransferase [Myxococcales bacterium]